jgi:hypothetical protein
MIEAVTLSTGNKGRFLLSLESSNDRAPPPPVQDIGSVLISAAKSSSRMGRGRVLILTSLPEQTLKKLKKGPCVWWVPFAPKDKDQMTMMMIANVETTIIGPLYIWRPPSVFGRTGGPHSLRFMLSSVMCGRPRKWPCQCSRRRGYGQLKRSPGHPHNQSRIVCM